MKAPAEARLAGHLVANPKPVMTVPAEGERRKVEPRPARLKEEVIALATVREQLDAFHAGKLTIEQLASDFARRDWPKMPDLTEAQLHGVEDIGPESEDSFAHVVNDPRLSAEDYETIYHAVKGDKIVS